MYITSLLFVFMSIQNFKKAVKKIGSQSDFAQKLPRGKPVTVAKWISRGRVPPERVIEVCAAVKFSVTPHEIRPDIYPHPDDGLPDEMRCECKE